MFLGILRMKSLIVNGSARHYEQRKLPATLKDLLAELNIEAATVVAEIDGEITACQQFDQTKLRDGQKIELIRFMGGG